MLSTNVSANIAVVTFNVNGKMATAMFAETFVNTQNSKRLTPESRSYTYRMQCYTFIKLLGVLTDITPCNQRIDRYHALQPVY
jgi:hypothetical protein